MLRFTSFLSLLVPLLLLSCSAPPEGLPVAAQEAALCMGPSTGECGGALACRGGQRCVSGLCVPDFGTCAKDSDCISDTYCIRPPDIAGTEGVCVPWGTFGRRPNDALCSAPKFAATEFSAPVLHCRWMGSVLYVNPIVADLEQDGQPEIITPVGGGKLVILNGADCKLKREGGSNIAPYVEIAAADLDGDGDLEILAGGQSGQQLIVLDHNLNTLVTATDAINNAAYGPTISVSNIDGKDGPEILIGRTLYRYRAGTPPTLERLWSGNAIMPGICTYGVTPVIADLDEDGVDEVVYGGSIRDGLTGANKTPAFMAPYERYCHAAVADFNKDGKPELIVSTGQYGATIKVAVLDLAAQQVLLDASAATAGGGPLTIADFDGDGVVDIGSAGQSFYTVFALKCAQGAKPPECKGTLPGILWQASNQDASSATTGSSVFDFNGDGKAEVVYRDEVSLRVFDATNGNVLFSTPARSGTLIEYPLIADIDNDGHAEIVVPNDGFGHIDVYKDSKNAWQPSRPIWNQHAYSIVNINDDGTVPLRQRPSWKTFNSFRQNSSSNFLGGTSFVGDATAQSAGLCTGTALKARVCNRGSGAIEPGLPVAFYFGDPRSGGARQCVGRTSRQLRLGSCEEVGCTAPAAPGAGQPVWVNVNDNGNGVRVYNECKQDSGNYGRVCNAGGGATDRGDVRRCSDDNQCPTGQSCEPRSGLCQARAGDCQGSPLGACQSSACADLSIRISHRPDFAEPGAPIEYRVEVRNNGPAPVVNPLVTFTVPPGLDIGREPAGEGWSCARQGGTYRCTRLSLAPGDAPPITFLATPRDAAGSTTGNSAPLLTGAAGAAGYEDPDPSNNVFSADTRDKQRTRSDISLRIVKEPSDTPIGQEQHYTVLYKNKGPDLLRGARFVLTLPPGSTITKAPAGEGWSCVHSGDMVTCLRASAEVGDAPPVKLSIVPPFVPNPAASPEIGGAVAGVATAAQNQDPDFADNSAVVSAGERRPTRAELSVVLSQAPPPPRPGSELSYTAQVSNRGPDTAFNALVSFELPPHSRISQLPAGEGWNCTLSGRTALCSRGRLPVGEAPPISFRLVPETPSSNEVFPDVGGGLAAVRAADNTDGAAADDVSVLRGGPFDGERDDGPRRGETAGPSPDPGGDNPPGGAPPRLAGGGLGCACSIGSSGAGWDAGGALLALAVLLGRRHRRQLRKSQGPLGSAPADG